MIPAAWFCSPFVCFCRRDPAALKDSGSRPAVRTEAKQSARDRVRGGRAGGCPRGARLHVMVALDGQEAVLGLFGAGEAQQLHALLRLEAQQVLQLLREHHRLRPVLQPTPPASAAALQSATSQPECNVSGVWWPEAHPDHTSAREHSPGGRRWLGTRARPLLPGWLSSVSDSMRHQASVGTGSEPRPDSASEHPWATGSRCPTIHRERP